ncbi:hypothetical protein BKA70DRAFT_1439435 [Coprinopsis sp. MPI-PUGE-AT-0042]|nr:hypothetical protein BKA70DRAFT_1439435 [Coprinopsis sp. MPI-PUGE-AT-0042]
MSSEHEILELEEWLQRHYNHVEPSGETGGEDIHVFAILEEPVFEVEKASADKCYSINFGVGPATFTVKACINVAEKKLSVCVSVSVGPLSKELGCVDGSLSEGVTIKFNWYVVKGSLTFYVKDNALWVHWDITVLGKQYTGDVKLIPIPPTEATVIQDTAESLAPLLCVP